MCDDNNKENEENIVSQGILHILTDNIEGFQIQDQQSQIMQQPQQHNTNNNLIHGGVRRGCETLVSFPQWSLPNQVHSFNDPFLLIPPPPPPQPPPDLLHRRLQFGYDVVGSSDHHHLTRLFSDHSATFGLHAEMQKMSAQEIMDAKALAASKSHSEAERRRRERINNHLAKLRTLLPSTTKTDKASLLAEVIQHVKELKRQTCLIAETSLVPTETDELTVDDAWDEEGRPLIKASICCEDRSDLLPDMIKALKALRLRTLKAEITTLGGRVKNVLFMTGEEPESMVGNGEGDNGQGYCISSIHEALKAVVDKGNGDESAGSGTVKRQRTNINIL